MISFASHLLRLTLISAGLAIASVALAVNPDEVLDDPVLESRARALSAELRCLVCQNQSIDDSDADLARDLRILVRERLKAGDSDKEVKAFLVASYGEFVLLKPPFNLQTLLLWLTVPGLLIAVGGWLFLRHRLAAPYPTEVIEPLNDEEKARLDEILRG